MKYGSVCSGIEAATSAWHPLGWEASWYSEIEAFPSEVLAHHYPEVPNLGDFTKIKDMIKSREVEAPDLIVGGTPCQAFSIAGLRNSLDDDRGNLSLQFVELINANDNVRHTRGERGTIVVWENVPGVLNTKDNAFGCFLGALAGADSPLCSPLEQGRWSDSGLVAGSRRFVSWRILDAQYIGLAQRRRRVFVIAYPVGDFRDWSNSVTLFPQSKGMRRHPKPSREERKVTPTISESGTGVSRVGFNCEDEWFIECMASGQANAEIGHNISPALNCNRDGAPIAFPSLLSSTQCASTEDLSPSLMTKNHMAVSYAVRTANTSANGHGIAEECCHTLDQAQGQAVAYSIMPMNSGRDYKAREIDVAQPLMTQPVGGNQGGDYVCAFAQNSRDELREMEVTGALAAEPGMKQTSYIRKDMQVRRLTPIECERLQGFPDNHTKIPWRKKSADDCPDGPRYKSLGNSMAVPVMRWIGKRIDDVIKHQGEADET